MVNPVISNIQQFSVSPEAPASPGEGKGPGEADKQLFLFPSSVAGRASYRLSQPITLKAELCEQPCSALHAPDRAGSLWSPFFGQGVTGRG